MKTQPCNECPFRKKSAPGYLGGFGVEDTIQTAVSESDFVCHKVRGKKKEHQCVGRLLFSKIMCKLFRDEKLGNLQKEAVENNPFYKILILDWNEFKQHHQKAIKIR